MTIAIGLGGLIATGGFSALAAADTQAKTAVSATPVATPAAARSSRTRAPSAARQNSGTVTTGGS
jgi:hypothetical protein